MTLFQGIITTAVSISLIACGGSSNAPSAATDSTIQQPPLYENRPASVAPDAKGVLHLNAENGAGIGTGIKYMPEWRAFGWFRSADRVEWTVEVPQTGAYKATLEWSVSDEEAGKEFALEAGAEKIEGTVGKSGSWETFKSAEIGTIHLTAGKQKIVFKPNKPFDDAGALLDLRHVVLEPVTP